MARWASSFLGVSQVQVGVNGTTTQAFVALGTMQQLGFWQAQHTGAALFTIDPLAGASFVTMQLNGQVTGFPVRSGQFASSSPFGQALGALITFGPQLVWQLTYIDYGF